MPIYYAYRRDNKTNFNKWKAFQSVILHVVLSGQDKYCITKNAMTHVYVAISVRIIHYNV